MLRQRSTLAVARARRPRLLPRGVLAVFVVLVLAALVLMYPYRVLLDRVLHDTRGDQLTVDYLRAMLRTDPNNADVRLMLARQWLGRNEFAAARSVLTPLLAGPAARQVEARLLLWEVAEQEWRRLADGDPQREAVRRSLLQELHQLARLPLTELDRFELAVRGLELGDRAFALAIYRDLREGQLPPDWFLSQSRLYLGQGEYEAAAEVLMIARHRERAPAAARRLFFAAVDALRQSGRVADALALAERELGALGNEVEALEYMTRLALAAGRPDIAAKYARRMLKLTLLEQMRQLARLHPAGDAAVQLRPVSLEAAPAPMTPGPQAPFDDRRYTLGYEVFLANRELDAAWRVAASAVRQMPESAAWRQRLAQVSEWSGRADEALRQWRWLAERGSSAAATDALLRLAPGLFDDEALVLGLRQRISTQPGDPRLLGALVDAYERMGDPEAAIAFLRARARQQPDRNTLQALADVAERAADPPLAIATLREMDQRFGPDATRAFRRSGFHLLRGELNAAYEALVAAQALVPASEVNYWRRLARVALMLQRDQSAEAAYARLIEGGTAAPADYDVLVELLAGEEPARAGDLAAQAWKLYPSLSRLLRTLDLWAASAAWGKIGRLLGELDSASLAQAETDVRFLRLRARYLRETGRSAAALADLRRVLVLASGDADAREAYLWQLVDRREHHTLRRLLARHEANWAREPALHDALAAAWLSLSRPRLALERYLTPRVAAHRGDFLWMMNLADAYDQDQQTDRAWRLRAALWRTRRNVAPEDAPLPEAARRVAWVRLANSLRPGDPALAALRELLRLDTAAGQPADAASKELVLAWYQDQGLPEAVRQYLWARYARHAQLPLWAQMSAALNSGDEATAAALFERWGSAVSRYDQITVARNLGDDAFAASLAFDAQTQQRDDEALQQQLEELLPRRATRPMIEVEAGHFDTWREVTERYSLATQVTPALRLSAVLGSTQRQFDERALALPDSRAATLALAWRTDTGEVQLDAGAHRAAKDWASLGMSQRWKLRQDVDLGWKLAWREPAIESLALRSVGWRDTLAGEAGLALTAADRLNVQIEWHRYAAQDAQALGEGRLLSLNFSHAFRRQARDLFGEAYVTHFRSQVADSVPQGEVAGLSVAGLLPQGYDLVGARLRSDTRFANDYTRGWRLYGSAGVSWNSESGTGFDLALGAAGGVFGADHLALDLRREQGQTANITSSTVLGLRYWIDF